MWNSLAMGTLVSTTIFLHMATLVVTNSKTCEDLIGSEACGKLERRGACTHPNTRDQMRINCPETCNQCPEDIDGCKDSSQYCAEWKRAGICESFNENPMWEVVMVTQCPKTCNLCHFCLDVYTDCMSLKKAGLCESQVQLMDKNCRKTCGYCQKDGPHWGGWGSWSTCDVICGEGVQQRYRQCQGSSCEGDGTEQASCTMGECPDYVCGSDDPECTFYKDMNYCHRSESIMFMKEHCGVSCGMCSDDHNLSQVVALDERYKRCVDRHVNLTITSSIRHDHSPDNPALRQFTLSRDRLERLQELVSHGDEFMTLRRDALEEMYHHVALRCGVVEQGSTYIEEAIMRLKNIKYGSSGLDCRDTCSGQNLSEVFRRPNGTCNNCDNSMVGSAGDTMERLLPAEFEDNTGSLPRGWAQNTPGSTPKRDDLPSPRVISRVLLGNVDITTHRLSLMHFQWGQFLDHDLALTPLSQGTTGVNCRETCVNEGPCFPIPLSESDPLSQGGRRKCLSFTRSGAITVLALDNTTKTHHITRLTSYVDASVVYGSTELVEVLLRGPRGELRVEDGCKGGSPNQGPMLPPCPPVGQHLFCECPLGSCPGMLLAGDQRVNEQPMLTVMHTLWVREHNRVARQLTELNTCWGEERVYRTARRIVTAQIQHITYGLYLPILLGPTGYNRYIGLGVKYNPQVKAKLLEEFATAAFRFGHSQIPSAVPAVDETWRRDDNRSVPLHRAFFRPEVVCTTGMDNILRGLILTPVNRADEHFTPEVTERLFAPQPHTPGGDLVSMNIQRGRDHGLPPYPRYVEYCQQRYGLQPSFKDGSNTRNLLKQVYGSLDRVDLYVGGVLEEPVDDGLVGPTLACIIGEQFRRLRQGDRFFYTNEGMFTEEQLAEITKSDVSSVVCDNSPTIHKLPKRSFLTGDPKEFVPCSDIARMDMRYWKDDKCSR